VVCHVVWIHHWGCGTFLILIVFHTHPEKENAEKTLCKCSSKQSVIHKSHDGIGNSQSQFLDFLAKKVIWYKYGTAKE